MFHLLSYTTTTAGAVTLSNLGMVADGAIAQGSTGYRFTEPYKLLAAFPHAASLTQVEIRSPTLDGLSRWNVWPLTLSLNIPGNPQVDDYRPFAPILPLYEDVSCAVSDTAVGGEQIIVHEWIGTQGWTPDLGILNSMFGRGDPYIGRRMTVNCTPTLNKGAGAWGADVALTFEQLPRGGVYAVIGGECVAAACSAWRINFSRSPLYQGRKLFPGDIVQQAVGDVPKKQGRNWLGVWGVFHTWELPFASLFGQAAGTVAVNLNLDVVYLGGNESPTEVLNSALQVLQNAA